MFFIIDWDTLIIAPKERDLMFIGGGIEKTWITEKEINSFYRGYKNKDIDYRLLAFYRLERVLVDIVEYYENIVDIKNCKKERENSINTLERLFEQNNAIDIAMRTYEEYK
jgi:spectinomycin phosphotransferase